MGLCLLNVSYLICIVSNGTKKMKVKLFCKIVTKDNNLGVWKTWNPESRNGTRTGTVTGVNQETLTLVCSGQTGLIPFQIRSRYTIQDGSPSSGSVSGFCVLHTPNNFNPNWYMLQFVYVYLEVRRQVLHRKTQHL